MTITKKMAYSLGFLWADGWLMKNSKNIGLYIVTEDFNEIKDVLWELVPYNKVNVRYTDNPKHREQSGFNLCDEGIYTFLSENGYKDKSYCSAKDILESITPDLIPYFIRGFFDGDGTVSDTNSNTLSFTGHYEQDWSWLSDILTSLDIEHNYYQNISDGGSLSRISIYNIPNCVKLFNYIYPNMFYDFGLTRKFKKLSNIYNKTTDDYINKCILKRISQIEYFFHDTDTDTYFSICGEKNVYEFFKDKNKDLRGKNRFSGQKIIDKVGSVQKNYVFLHKERVKKHLGL